MDAAVAAEVASLRSELLSSNAAVADLTKRVAAEKSGAEKPDPFQEELDDRRFCPHYKTEDPGADGVVRLNLHQDPPRPLGCAFKPHLLPGLHKSDLSSLDIPLESLSSCVDLPFGSLSSYYMYM